MEKKTYKGIEPERLYTIKEVSMLLKKSREYLSKKISDNSDPLQYIVDEQTKRMKIRGSELIRYFNINE